MQIATAAILIACLASISCAPRDAYVPAATAPATAQRRLAAACDVPTETPEGDVRVASFGVTEIKAEDKTERLRALHLRLVFDNNGTAPWTFDTQQQRVDLDGHGPLSPAFASANAGSAPPIITVARNTKRVVDLFFLLPPRLQNADEIPDFDAVWKVQRDHDLLAQRTPFERISVEPDSETLWTSDYYGAGYYWAGPYWMNPAFPYEGLPNGYFGAGVVIRRAPHIVYPRAHRDVEHGLHHANGR